MKIFILTTCFFLLLSCNNPEEARKENTVESAPNITNLQNVNGRQPDTINTIELTNRTTTDSILPGNNR